MMSPTNGATASQTVMISANATDSSGVPSVQFQLDGANVGGSIAVSPYNFSWNTTTTSNGSHTLRAIAKDASGQTSTSSSVTVTVNNSTTDTTPPSVPAGLVGTAISSSQINLSWTASTDNVGVTGYNVYRGGTKIGTSGTTSYSDTGLTASTTYTYTVAAYDAAGNASAQSASVSATTNPAASLTVSMMSPTNGATVSQTVMVSANATDSSGVPSVQFQLDGANIGGSIAVSPYNFSWNTTTTSNGSHTLRAIAKDASGQTSTSSSVTVTVNNSTTDTTPPSVPAGLVGTAISSSQINLSWTASTDNVGVTGYNVYRGGTKIGTSGTTSYSDTGLTASTTYTYTVAAYDAAGNASAQSASVSATTNPAASLAVSMMSPTNGATVSQTVMISANATDSSGVPSVQFQLDGANIGGSIAVSPYNFSWNTTTTSNGSHTLRAIAKDASGQTSTSSSVTVTVNNSTTDTTPPSVPAGLVGTAISSSQINLSWTASTDNVGVTGYNVYRGGTKIGTSGTTSYSDTGLTASTTYTYTVAAYDA